MALKLLEAGKIVTTHGNRGELKLYPYADDAEFLLQFKYFYIDGKTTEPYNLRVHKGMLLFSLPSINTVSEASAYINKIVWFDSEEVPLPQNTYYNADIIGFSVYDNRTKKTIGILSDVLIKPAGNIFLVKEGEKEILIPTAGGFINNIDLKNRLIVIDSIEGMI